MLLIWMCQGGTAALLFLIYLPQIEPLIPPGWFTPSPPVGTPIPVHPLDIFKLSEKCQKFIQDFVAFDHQNLKFSKFNLAKICLMTTSFSNFLQNIFFTLLLPACLPNEIPLGMPHPWACFQYTFDGCYSVYLSIRKNETKANSFIFFFFYKNRGNIFFT